MGVDTCPNNASKTVYRLRLFVWSFLSFPLRDLSVSVLRHEPGALADHCRDRVWEIYFLLSDLPSREPAWDASWALGFLVISRMNGSLQVDDGPRKNRDTLYMMVK